MNFSHERMRNYQYLSFYTRHTWSVVLVFAAFFHSNSVAIIVLFVLGLLFGRSTDYDSWLEKG